LVLETIFFVLSEPNVKKQGKMSDLCTNPPPGIIKGSPYHIVSLVFTIVFPLFLTFQLALFIWYRSYSVFVRKRSLLLTIQLFVGAIMTWAYTVLYDYLGSENYPCWLFQFLNYFATPIMATVIFLSTAQYLSEISAIRIEREMMSKNNPPGTILKEQDSKESSLRIIQGKATLRTFAAHMRRVFRIRFIKANKQQERILNLQFVKSYAFKPFWLAIASLPFVIAYVVRIGTDPQWTNCTGCELSIFDSAFALGIFALGTLIGERSHPGHVAQDDALRIIREAKWSWRVGFVAVISHSLYIADPSSIYKNGYFNWRFIFFIAAGLLTYVKTTHQVLMAHRLRRQLLTSVFIDREDRYSDVMNSKELRQAFYNHLDSELSPEIYRFLHAVDEYKANFERQKEAKAAQGKEIFETYIQKKAPCEINLSASIREKVTINCVTANYDLYIFDEAYVELKKHLLNDGFARFLINLNRSKRHLGSTSKDNTMLTSSPNSTGDIA
jgi:hypothetical protein